MDQSLKMPDVSDLDLPMVNYLLSRLLGGDKGRSEKAWNYTRNVFRLLDKSINEYQKARECLIADLEEEKKPAGLLAITGRRLNFIDFTNHIETSINSTARILKLLDRLKTEQTSPGIPKILRKVTDSLKREVVNVRDTVEHIDELIQREATGPGPVMILLSDDGDTVEIGSCKIRVDQYASLLRNLHLTCRHLLEME